MSAFRPKESTRRYPQSGESNTTMDKNENVCVPLLMEPYVVVIHFTKQFQIRLKRLTFLGLSQTSVLY